MLQLILLSTLFIVLSACSNDTRTITLVTPFHVKTPVPSTMGKIEPNKNFHSSVITPENEIGNGIEEGGGPIALPNLNLSEYCIQDDIRLSYTDPRPGYPSFSERINLVTKRDASAWQPLLSASGLDTAMNWLTDPSKSYLLAPISFTLPYQSRGTFRIEGTFVKPEGTTGVTCPKVSPSSTPYPTFTLLGEANIQPGGPSNVPVRVNVVATRAFSYTDTLTPYGTPEPTSTGAINPTITPSLKCADTSKRSTCPNRHLIEFELDQAITANYLIESRNHPSLPLFETNLKGYTNSNNHSYFYLYKKPFFLIKYQIYVPGNSDVDFVILVNLLEKKYSYFDIISNSRKLYSMHEMGGGQWGIKIPTTSMPSPTAPTDDTFYDSSNHPDGPNLIITDLGEGFY